VQKVKHEMQEEISLESKPVNRRLVVDIYKTVGPKLVPIV